MTRRTSSATSLTSRCTVSTSSFLSRPIGLSSISGVMRPFIVDRTSSSILAMTLTLELGVERVAEQLVELGAEGGEGAGERAVLLVEQTARGAGDLVDRVGDAGLEARLELVERALDHVDVDGDVRGPRAPGHRCAGTGGSPPTGRRTRTRCARPRGRAPRARGRRRRRRRRGPVPGCREWVLRSSCHPPTAVAVPPSRASPVSDRGATSTSGPGDHWRAPISGTVRRQPGVGARGLRETDRQWGSGR